MLPLKAVFRLDIYAWEIVRVYYLSASIFLTLSCIAACESFALFSSSNSSCFHSPSHSAFLTSTPTLSGIAHGQTLRSTQGLSSVQFSLETTINSVNDGFVSKFGVHTGVDDTPQTTEVLSSSILKLDAQNVETTQESHSVGNALQTENRNSGESTKGSGNLNLQTLQFTSSRLSAAGTVLNQVMQTSTRMTLKSLSSFDSKGMITTQAILPHFRFSAGSAVKSISKTSIALSPSSVVSDKLERVTRTTELARYSSVLSSSEKFAGSVSSLMSNLHATNYIISTYDLSSRAGRSKSAILSHYSTGITSTQAQGLSSSKVQNTSKVSSRPTTAQVSSTFPSSTTARVSSYFTSSTITRASPSFTSSTTVQASTSLRSSSSFRSIAKSALSTPHVHLTRATTASLFAHITSVQPLLSSSLPVQGKATLTCKVNNATCVCFNCEEARRNGQLCCMDLIDIKNIQQGVALNMLNITVQEFYHKVKAVWRIITEVVWDSCRANASLCVTDTEGKRKRRSSQEHILKNNPSSDRVRTKREALRPDIKPSVTYITHVDVIIYSISSEGGHPPRVQTSLYVTVTSLNNRTNQTVVLDGKSLLQILRDKRGDLENRLNITIDSFTAWQKSSKLANTSSSQSTPMPNPSPGSHNMQTPLSTREGRYL